MEHDLKKLFKEQREKEKYTMKSGHEERFMKRLENDLPSNKRPKFYPWLGIAASVVVLLGLASYIFLLNPNPNEGVPRVVQKDPDVVTTQTIGLGDLSPELEKIENYYVTNINLALSKLEISDDNKDIVDGYLERLEELNEEYKRLNEELNELGPNDQTIMAMVQNLQLRAQLLQQLNEKLNQLKSSKNEQNTNII